MTTAFRFGDVWTFEYFQSQQNLMSSGTARVLDVDQVHRLLQEIAQELSRVIDPPSESNISNRVDAERIVS